MDSAYTSRTPVQNGGSESATPLVVSMARSATPRRMAASRPSAVPATALTAAARTAIRPVTGSLSSRSWPTECPSMIDVPRFPRTTPAR